MYEKKHEAFELVGRLQPKYACQDFSFHYQTVKGGNKVHIVGDSVKVEIRETFVADVPFVVRSAVMNITGTLDGQLLITGQPIQAYFEHDALRRGEGEIISTSHQDFPRLVTQEQLRVGISIGQMAQLIPPLAHALRDFRLANILPREDAAAFLWRSLESILWFLADDKVPKAEAKSNIVDVAAKLGVDPNQFIQVRERVNHQSKFGRHGSKIYRDRLAFLKKVYGTKTPPLFTEPIALGDQGAIDVYPISFPDSDWETMIQATWEILTRFIPYLNPYTRGMLVQFNEWR